MRNQVIQVTCARCTRVESFAKDPGDRSLTVTFAGKEICKFDDLCNNCHELVGKALENVAKPLKKTSPVREKKAPEPAAETTPPVKVSPPKRS